MERLGTITRLPNPTIVVAEPKRAEVEAVLHPDMRCLPLPAEGPLPAEAVEADILLHWGISLERFAECASLFSELKWIHTFWAGTERILPIVRRFPGAPRFTDSRGTYEIPIAEHGVGLLLGLLRGFPRHVDSQRRSQWRPATGEELYGRRVLVLGAGRIGARIGRLLLAFGAEVVGIRRRLGIESPFPLFSLEELDRILPSVSVVVASLPETDDTRGLLSVERLRSLPRSSYLINVGRGSVLDQDALPELLRTGQLAGAALDVFTEEPLSPASPLWKTPGIWISPHCAGLSPAMNERRLRLFLDNLQAYRAGRPLRNETPG